MRKSLALKSHGPSVGKLAGHKVAIEGLDQPVIVDTSNTTPSSSTSNPSTNPSEPASHEPSSG
jgi:hypothetical protein